MTAANDNRFTVADVRRAIKAAEAVGKAWPAVDFPKEGGHLCSRACCARPAKSGAARRTNGMMFALAKGMAKIDLKYVKVYKDRHGRLRHYYRRKGPALRFRAFLGSAEFMAAYAEAEGRAPRQAS